MYELNPIWEKFYTELKPEKRKKILKEIIEKEEDDGANEFRQMLLKKRYVNPKDPNHHWDLFLLQCTYLPSLYRKRKFFLINMKKEVAKTVSDLCLENQETFTETERTAAYWEMKNAARRYFKTCSGSKYGSSLFGLSKKNDEQKAHLAAKDAWQMSFGMVPYEKKAGELKIFCDAVQAAFEESYEEGAELFQIAVELHKNDEK